MKCWILLVFYIIRNISNIVKYCQIKVSTVISDFSVISVDIFILQKIGVIFISAKLLAIDSSTTKSGCAYFCNGKYKEHLLLDCRKDKNMDSRFEAMSQKLWGVLEIYKPNIVCIEETVVLRNAQTQRFLTRLQGIIYAWCMNHGCEFNTIRPTSWKRDQLKEQSVHYVLENYNLNVGDDEADAICIGDAVMKIYEDKK